MSRPGCTGQTSVVYQTVQVMPAVLAAPQCQGEDHMKRPMKLGLSALALLTGTVLAQSVLPKLAVKPTYRVGFAQTESNNPWRLAQTKSMQDEAKKLGYTLVYTDAGGSTAKQVTDVRSMIA